MSGFSKLINGIRYGADLRKIRYDKEKQIYIYRDGNKIYEFNKISSVIDDTLLKIILQKNKRCNECRTSSAELAEMLKSTRNILTGYYYVDNGRFVHTVVETEANGESYIYDYSSNIIMKKSQYIELFKFELIKATSIEDYRSDKEEMQSKGVSLKEYLTSFEKPEGEIITEKKERTTELTQDKNVLR